MIYLDHAATTPIDPAVNSYMDEIGRAYYANPSSIHSMGQQSKVLLENCRKIISASIGAKSGEIVFTSGGTEANNFALIGAARANKGIGNHIITSKVEHPAVLETCRYLSENGFQVSYIDVNQDGLLDLEQFKQSIRKETILVSLMMVNNETGCLLPIREIGEIIKDQKIIFHCDAIQGFGKLEIKVDELNVDLLSLSAHKLYGPKGCGALYVRQSTPIEKIIFGGSQEIARRPGTENLTGVAGFAKAVEVLQTETNFIETLLTLCNLLEERLKNAFPNLEINGENTTRVPGISNVYFPFMSGESLLMNLDLQGVAVSTGSACSSGSQKPSHVLRAMGYNDQRVNNSLRFSLGKDTTEEEILKTIDVLKNIHENTKK